MIRLIAVLILLCPLASAESFKVFILAGQSNMQGQGVVEMDHPKYYNGGKGNLVWSMKNSKSREMMKHLRDAAGGEDPACTGSLPALGPPLQSSTRPSHTYILHPCKVGMRVGYDTPGALFDLARPRISMEATLPVVSLEMKRWQLLCAVKVMDLFDGRRRLLLERPGRPRSSPLQDPRAWWRYVGAFLREEVADRRRRCSAAYMLERRQSRLEYCGLYLQQRDDTLSLQGAARLQAIEAAHGFNDIVYFRCTAIRQLQQQSDLETQLAIIQAETGYDVRGLKPIPKIDAAVLDVRDVNDDLQREKTFYMMALQAVKEGHQRCEEMGISYKRPEDFFAEMLKSDAHMLKVQNRILTLKRAEEEMGRQASHF